jgi:hypothetical protein
MEPFTLAGIVALVLVGIFNKTGEVIVEESVEQIKKQLVEKSPNTLEQLKASSEDNTDALAQPIQMMATLIEKDGVFKQLAETVAKQNLDKQAQAIKIIKNLGFIAEAGSNVTVTQNFD